MRKSADHFKRGFPQLAAEVKGHTDHYPTA
jgi:hypothetical protein